MNYIRRKENVTSKTGGLVITTICKLPLTVHSKQRFKKL